MGKLTSEMVLEKLKSAGYSDVEYLVEILKNSGTDGRIINKILNDLYTAVERIFIKGLALGFAEGSQDGYDIGCVEGYHDGYADGYDAGIEGGYFE